MNPFSVRVSEENGLFLGKMAALGNSKTETVNAALDLLRKLKLREELSALAQDDAEGERALAEEGMQDYLALLDNAA